MYRSWMLWCFLWLSSSLLAQFHEPVFPGESGSSLISKLRTTYRPGNVLSYRDARIEMYTKIYNQNDSVECVYTGHRLHLEPNDPDPIGSLSMNGSSVGINCEHTFPQSKGAGSGNPRSDMHHLFPTRSRVNEARLNYPFSEVIDRTTLTWFIGDREQQDIPQENRDAYSELGFDAFEPKEAHKGNAARAIFYFYAIYREVADSDFFGEQRQTLCEWHYADPVDSLEWTRNTMIASYQEDKKNPFILDCSLAFRTYCPDVEEQCEFTNIRETLGIIEEVYPSPATDILYVVTDRVKSGFFLQVINELGQVVLPSISLSQRRHALPIQSLVQGIYWIQIIDPVEGILGQSRFVKQ